MMKALHTSFALALAVAALAGCAQEKPLYVDQAWIQMNPVPTNPSAGYFTVHGGAAAVKLLSVTTPVALRTEIHESMTGEAGMASMKPVDAVDVAAGEDVTFKPGGKHLMIWGINPGAVKMGKVPLTFIFSNGDRILFDAVVRQAGEGAPAPAHNAMSHEAH